MSSLPLQPFLKLSHLLWLECKFYGLTLDPQCSSVERRGLMDDRLMLPWEWARYQGEVSPLFLFLALSYLLLCYDAPKKLLIE
jgi:hypothetical protein